MTRKTWTEDELVILREMTAAGFTAAEIGKRLGRTVYSVDAARKQNGITQRLVAADSPVYPGLARLEGDALIVADVHIPCHDQEFLERLVDLAVRWGIKNLGIAGDLLDFETLSDLDHYSDVEISVTSQIEAASRMLTILGTEFDNIVYCAGNHERRLLRRLDTVDTLAEAMRLWTPERVQMTDYQWFTAVSGGEAYQVEHPCNISAIPAQVARGLAAKYHRNVIAGHGHLWGLTRDVSGRYWAIDSGVVCDPKRLAWVQKKHTTRPQMLQGAVIIRDGLPVLLSPEHVVSKVFAKS